MTASVLKYFALIGGLLIGCRGVEPLATTEPNPTLPLGPARGCSEEDVFLQVMLTLDNTVSMRPYYPPLTDVLPSVVQEYNITYEGGEYGLATFNDILNKCDGTGVGDNFCNRLVWPLGTLRSELVALLSSLSANSDDFTAAEDSLGAMAAQSANPRAMWKHISPTGMKTTKIMLVFTDDTYRYPDDYGMLPWPCTNLPNNDGGWDYRCGEEKFYTEEQAAKLIIDSGVHPVVFTLEAAAGNYTDFFAKYNIPGSVFHLHEDRKILTARLLAAVGEVVCNDLTTSTIPPSTDASTDAISTEASTEAPNTTNPTVSESTTSCPCQCDTTTTTTVGCPATTAEPSCAATTQTNPSPASQSTGRSSTASNVGIAVGSAGGGAAAAAGVGAVLYKRAMKNSSAASPSDVEGGEMPDDFGAQQEQATSIDGTLFD